MNKIIHIANRLHDSKAWTPEQCLREALTDFATGDIAVSDAGIKGEVKQLAIHYYIEHSDGRLRPCHYVAGMNSAEYVALLTLSLQKAIEDWRA